MIPLKVLHRNDKGPALLLIHGFPLDQRLWQNQIDRLPFALRLIVPDLRGCGGSPLPPGPCAIDDYGRDLLSLMNELKASASTSPATRWAAISFSRCCARPPRGSSA